MSNFVGVPPKFFCKFSVISNVSLILLDMKIRYFAY